MNQRKLVSYGCFSLLLFLMAGCASISEMKKMDEKYGAADALRYEIPVQSARGGPEYWKDVRPIMAQRCIVCHGCYDAPCQQNLTSWEGITRGASPMEVYGLRLKPASPTRLFIDAQTPGEWRKKDFHPALNERNNTAEANLEGSVLYRLLDLKRKNPLPSSPIINEGGLDFSIVRKQVCPDIEKMDRYEKKHPQWGMPFGLPNLSPEQFATMENWIKDGAPSGLPPVDENYQAEKIRDWETFFNGASYKEQLMSRYLYEHLFLAHLHFDDHSSPDTAVHPYFRMVRSLTPPGEPVKEIASRRPYEDPGTQKFWYRLRADFSSVVVKTHMPYALNAERMTKWKAWFLEPAYEVSVLPAYGAEVAANPFIAFQDIPVRARYRFLLDEAHFTIDNFIKGPVCRGQIALSVIDEQFWVFFVDPDQISGELDEAFLAKESNHLRLPAESESNARFAAWVKYAKMQKKYLKAKQQYLADTFGKPERLTTALIWDGGGTNDNAALTIFRHGDSASVAKGLVGLSPKTTWIVGYPLLERIHYLLVAGFDIFGNLAHQLNTRLYMDFMRMEAETNFLALLPEKDRQSLRDYWYRGASKSVKEYLYGDKFNFTVETGIEYLTDQPQQELYGLLKARVGDALAHEFDLENVKDSGLRDSMKKMQEIRGAALQWLPEMMFLRVTDSSEGAHYFTLLHNNGFTNISELMKTKKRRRPAEDSLSAVPGILGAYPNIFLRVQASALEDFMSQLASLNSEKDYRVFLDRFGVRRTSSDFWAYSDEMQKAYLESDPLRSGILDYSRFENR